MDFSKESFEVKHLYHKMEEIAEGDESEVRVFEEDQSPVLTTLRDHLWIWGKEGASLST